MFNAKTDNVFITLFIKIFGLKSKQTFEVNEKLMSN